jgi:hypothetical protein
MFNRRIFLLSCLIASLLIGLTGCAVKSVPEEAGKDQGYTGPVKSVPEEAANEQNHTPGEAVNNNQNTATGNMLKPLVLADFLPDRKMTKVFTGGFENSGMVHVVDKVTDRKVQIKQIDTGNTIAFVYEVTDEAILLVHVGRDNPAGDFTSKPDNRNDIVLKGPIQIGTFWEVRERTHTITQVDVQISTPAGVFRAIEVTVQDGDGKYNSTRYFGQGVGVIKAAFCVYENVLVGVFYDTGDEKLLGKVDIMAKYADYFDN